MVLRVWNGHAHNRARSVRGPTRSRQRKFSMIGAVAMIASIVVFAEYFICVWVRDYIALQKPQEEDREELMRLSASPLAALERDRGESLRGHQDLSLRGDETRAAEESSRGHGSMETIPTNHFGGGGAGSMASSQLVAAATTAAAAGSAGGVSSAAEGSKDLRNFHTVTTLRSGKCGALDCRVLITGCGRSGTHFLAEQLAGAGMPILHETIGEAGTVSWVHAAPFREELRELEEWFSDEKSVKLRSNKDFQFFPVFHLVRHPLAALTSLTECFCGCGSMACGGWADPPSWKWAGKFVNFSDRHCSRNINNEVCAAHKHRDGRLIRSMEYWLQWNQLAGSQAHFRIQLETVKLSEVIEAARQLDSTRVTDGASSSGAFEQKPFSSKRVKRRTVKSVSWELMRSADAALEAQVWELAQSYGYGR